MIATRHQSVEDDKGRELYPLPGRAFVGMGRNFSDTIGHLIIPKSAQRVSARVGRVFMVTLYEPDKLNLIFKDGILTAKEAWRDNDMYAELVNEWVVCRNPALLWGNLFEVRLEHILSIVPQEALPKNEDMDRCRSCRSRGASNILLGTDGYCPVCGFNNDGHHISENSIIVPTKWGDLSIQKPGEVTDEEAQMLMPKKEIIEGKIISFPGQKKRSSQ